MKRGKKFLGTLLSCLLLLALLAACGSPDAGPQQSGSDGSAPDGGSAGTDTLALDWTVEEGILDGERHLLFRFTNNSPHTILSYEFHFTEKPDITEEEKSANYDFTTETLSVEKETTPVREWEE